MREKNDTAALLDIGIDMHSSAIDIQTKFGATEPQLDADSLTDHSEDQDQSAKLFQHYCEQFQSAPRTNHNRDTPRDCIPFNPLDQSTNPHLHTGPVVEAWSIAS